MRRALAAALCLCAAAFAAGCDNPFPPGSLVERLRVLGVRAEPPEVGLDGEVVLSALVADPQGGGRPLSFEWAVCLSELSYQAADIDCPGADGYALPGSGDTARLSVPELVEFAAANLPAGSFGDPSAWKDLKWFPLIVGLRARAGGEVVRAIKRVRLRLATEEPPNANPRLLGLTLDGAEAPDLVQVKAGATVSFQALVDPATRERYRRQGESEERVEDVVFAWFASDGEFEGDYSVLSGDGTSEFDRNQWTAPGEPGQIELWVVARDGRFGEDWLERTLEVVP
ncbi:MAG: hypothetical protein GYA21_03535 [Myxococcales bacterium]|nr:hypothetical protein [Myxococcales bacterium]